MVDRLNGGVPTERDIEMRRQIRYEEELAENFQLAMEQQPSVSEIESSFSELSNRNFNRETLALTLSLLLDDIDTHNQKFSKDQRGVSYRITSLEVTVENKKIYIFLCEEYKQHRLSLRISERDLYGMTRLTEGLPVTRDKNGQLPLAGLFKKMGL